jgi:4-amino-4-deoxy-L-arabinose transferase-like glycosyltransferase
LGKKPGIAGSLFSSPAEMVLLLGIVTAVLCVHVLLLLTHGLYSDEAVYTYSAYAIARGVAPYQGIVLAHPPIMYYLLAVFIWFFGPQVVLLRLTNVVFFLLSVPLVFWLSRFFLQNASERERRLIPFFSSAVYGLYPSFFLFVPIEVPLDNILNLIVLACVSLYVVSYRTDNRKLFFSTGIVAGLALVETLRAVFFVVALFLFHLIAYLRRREFKFALKNTVTMLLGIAIPTAVFLFTLVSSGGFPQFYLQTVAFQVLRSPDSLLGRLGEILFYVNFMLPLIALAFLGAIYCVRTSKARNDSAFLLLPTLYVAGFVLLVLFTSTTMKHYFFYLTPYLVILAFMGFPLLREWLSGPRSRKGAIIAFLLVFGVVMQQTFSVAYAQTLPWFHQNNYNDLEYFVGKRVANLTEINDKIWTSEGAVALYADRLIAPPNSTSLPWHMMFKFELETSYGSGNKSTASSLYTFEPLEIRRFVESWESNHVKVIVIIRGEGWLPYPDELLWNGTAGEEGVANYVQSNYELRYLVTGTETGKPSNIESPYVYEIWARKSV